jgi:FMN phosphatase YigB (HAD superfamily)
MKISLQEKGGWAATNPPSVTTVDLEAMGDELAQEGHALAERVRKASTPKRDSSRDRDAMDFTVTIEDNEDTAVVSEPSTALSEEFAELLNWIKQHAETTHPKEEWLAIEVLFFDLGATLVTSSRTWQPGAKDLISTLKHQAIRLGIISNTGELSDRAAILDLLPVDFNLNDFETALVLFSSEVGIEKPDRQIFKLAVDLAAVPAEKSFYCSENAIETVVAQAAGMHSLRIVTGSTDLSQLPSFLSHLS